MNNKSANSVVSDLLQKARPTVVAERLGLAVKTIGSQSKALCPFHTDSDPSLVLYDQATGARPHFHCYACNAHGDIFHLVQQVRSCTFPEAVSWLTSAFGIASFSPDRARLSDRDLPQHADLRSSPSASMGFEKALEIYRLRNGTEKLKRWLDERSLPAFLIDQAELAYASYDTLTSHIRDATASSPNSRVDQGLLEDAGMIVPVRPSIAPGEYFLDLPIRLRDFFSESRALFPIRDLSGRLVGFGGRLVIANPQFNSPKYLYSPKLPRGKLVYRGDVVWRKLQSRKLPSAPATTYEDLYVCEGPIDVLRMESLGINAIGLLGSQCTDEQAKQIQEISDLVHKRGATLRCHIFLDRDEAGAKAAAKLAVKLAERTIESTYIWPTASELQQVAIPDKDRKDPDSILKSIHPNQVLQLLQTWRRPSALAVAAAELDALPEQILSTEKWQSFPLSRRFRAAHRLGRDSQLAQLLFDVSGIDAGKLKESWLSDILSFRSPERRNSPEVKEARQSTYIDESVARINHARALAKHGAERGELPADEASWRRIDIGATAFNIGFQDRLSNRYKFYGPMEPFDAVYVPRDFGKDESRLKAMPCPEDLVLQQYILAEILSERLDSTADCKFSDFIPAVRFYRDLNKTETTAEDLGFARHSETLSFAYQIDMDVLEGRTRASNQGMFRPYIECWRDFIRHLRVKAESFGEVYAVRLDLKRYYDRLSRSVIRDVLREPLTRAIKSLDADGSTPDFAQYFDERQSLSDKILDWLCEQSFGFEYYSPDSGDIKRSAPSTGVPQGPVLSAWLATVALFPLDTALRKAINSINGENDGTVQACYARYVDDIFLVASSQDVLLRLRAVAEEAAKRLRLELVQKGQLFPKMNSWEFQEMLTEGKAFVGSEPAREPGLLHLGDGEAGFETWHDADLHRASSLKLLNDRRLYLASDEDLLDQVFTAIQAEDLRPNELPKVSRWVWYYVASKGFDTPSEAWSIYWHIWTRLTSKVKWQLTAEKRPWEDPAFFALEGLERMLASSSVHDMRLLPEEEKTRSVHLQKLAKLSLDAQFVQGFLLPASNAPAGTGLGAQTLRRMFLQRLTGVRWISCQLLGDRSIASIDPSLAIGKGASLDGSLARARLAEFEITGAPSAPRADQGESQLTQNSIRRAFIWLHEAIVSFGFSTADNRDPLDSLVNDFTNNVLQHAEQEEKEIRRENSAIPNLVRLLELWLPTPVNDRQPSSDLRQTALIALLSVCNTDNLMSCLGSRSHLIDLNSAKLLPPLPGIPLKYLTSVITLGGASDRPGTLRELSQIFKANGEDRELPIAPRFATTKGLSSELELSWSAFTELAKSSVNKLEQRKASWSGPANLISLQAPGYPSEITPAHLKWAATLFELLAKINSDLRELGHGEDAVEVASEFVPAWPYVVTSFTREHGVTDTASASLVGPVLPSAILGSLAFFRDGAGRLKSVEVPIADGWLWRIGYAVTDLFGLADELDRYQKIDVPPLDQELKPAEYLLKSMLRRLRGDFAPTVALPRHPHATHLPASIYRALELLKHFPESEVSEAGFLYALSVEFESRAMASRLNSGWSFGRPGHGAAYLEQTATQVLLRLPAKWAAAFPTSQAVGLLPHLRRHVAAWHSLSNRLDELEEKGAAGERFVHPGWSALKAGVRLAAITAWLRALTFELETAKNFPIPAGMDIPQEWNTTDFAFVANGSVAEPRKLIEEALHKEEGSMAPLGRITPIGWLWLVVSRLGLYDSKECKVAPARLETLRAKATDLALVLLKHRPQDMDREGQATSAGAEKAPELQWPFDGVSEVQEAALNIYAQALSTLTEIDDALGFKVHAVEADSWGLKSRSPHFVDSNGKSWKFTKWLVEQVPREARIEERERGNNPRRVWSETRNANGDLVGVAVLGYSFFSFVSGNLPALAPASLEQAMLAPALASSSRAEQTASDMPLSSNGKAEPGDTADSKRPASIQVMTKWNGRLEEVWSSRAAKSLNHVRIALFQFRVDESYVHPLFEVGFPDSIENAIDAEGNLNRKADRQRLANSPPSTPRNEMHAELEKSAKSSETQANPDPLALARAAASIQGCEHIWDQSRLLPSWAEHRRRQLLERTVRSCDAFGVDVLVLPEYSVRPDTVAWLKKLLENTGSPLSVLAGTYRLHGDRHDLHFSQVFKDIFGLSDSDLIFPNFGTLSAEKSSYITLLHPAEVPGIGKMVSVFTRRKKYPSLAMGEVFNPSLERWSPLLTIDKLLSFLEKHTKEKQLKPISAQIAADLARKLPGAERLAELICSELFISTNPANWQSIRNEYNALRRRFGSAVKGQEDELTPDVEAFADYVGVTPNNSRTKADRRTILVVPAYTTRSADYWIYGQSALLAAGITTVFCAAVSKQSKGGSCFVGKSSWDNSKQERGIVGPVTPYSGWSRGIYYGNESGPLDPKEQAVVIADVDPVYMNEGKPRPQALPIPLQLVAYLPVVESVEPEDLARAMGHSDGKPNQKPLAGMAKTSQVAMLANAILNQAFVAQSVLLDPNKTHSLTGKTAKQLGEELKGIVENWDGFHSRLSAWSKNWRELPFYGPPPALIDWLWVDLTPTGDLPKVLVPPWKPAGIVADSSADQLIEK